MTVFAVPNEASATYGSQAELDAQDFAALSYALSGSGIIGLSCQVTPGNSGVDRSLVVSSGRVSIAGAGAVEIPKTTFASGSVTADATHPRWVLVVSDGSTVSLNVGTAAASPVFPTVTAFTVLLAAVYLPANASSVTSANIIDKAAMQSLTYQMTPQARVPARQSSALFRRGTFAAHGPPGSNGATLTNGVETTLYDSGDTAKGGYTGLTAAPGIVKRIALYVLTSGSNDEWTAIELPRLKVYYDGNTTADIDMPMRRWCGVVDLTSTDVVPDVRHPAWTFYSKLDTGGFGGRLLSFTFHLPLPFSSRCKVTFTPHTGVDPLMCWSLIDYQIGQNSGFGDRKARAVWWDYGSESTSGDRAGTNASTGRSDQSVVSLGEYHWWDAAWGSRLQASGGVDSSTTTFEVFNGPAFTRNLPVGVKDPRTGTAVTNTTTALAPDVFAMVDSEVVKITAISGNTLTVTRGQAHPITGAATTAASHAEGAMLKRIVGPTKVELWQLAMKSVGSIASFMEGPIGLYLDADTAPLSGGQLPTLGSGGTEDFFGVGWYALSAGNASDTQNPEHGCHHQRPWVACFYRWFNDIWADDCIALTMQNGESGQGSGAPGSTYYGSTLWLYTAH